ncbi:uncharacterized protein LOC144207366 isoform X1 [Stigmatopora nigra]
MEFDPAAAFAWCKVRRRRRCTTWDWILLHLALICHPWPRCKVTTWKMSSSNNWSLTSSSEDFWSSQLAVSKSVVRRPKAARGRSPTSPADRRMKTWWSDPPGTPVTLDAAAV